MPVLVDIQIAPQYRPLVEQQALRRAVEATAAHQGWQGEGEVVIVITDDEGIRELNLQFRNVDAPTDVLSFPGAVGEDFVTPAGYPGYLGDVIISYPRAEAQAQEAGQPVQREIQMLTVHGMLHLFGLDDEEEESWRHMMDVQNAILSTLPVPPPLKPEQTTGTAIE